MLVHLQEARELGGASRDQHAVEVLEIAQPERVAVSFRERYPFFPDVLEVPAGAAVGIQPNAGNHGDAAPAKSDGAIVGHVDALDVRVGHIEGGKLRALHPSVAVVVLPCRAPYQRSGGIDRIQQCVHPVLHAATSREEHGAGSRDLLAGQKSENRHIARAHGRSEQEILPSDPAHPDRFRWRLQPDVVGEPERVQGDPGQLPRPARRLAPIHRKPFRVQMDGRAVGSNLRIGGIHERQPLDLPQQRGILSGKHADVRASHGLHRDSRVAHVKVPCAVHSQAADPPESALAIGAAHRSGENAPFGSEGPKQGPAGAFALEDLHILVRPVVCNQQPTLSIEGHGGRVFHRADERAVRAGDVRNTVALVRSRSQLVQERSAVEIADPAGVATQAGGSGIGGIQPPIFVNPVSLVVGRVRRVSFVPEAFREHQRAGILVAVHVDHVHVFQEVLDMVFRASRGVGQPMDLGR